MRIKVISDIHTEFHNTDLSKSFLDSVPNENIDLLIVAGDLSTGYKKRIKPNLRQLCNRFPHVLYVLGNHDCWYSSIEKRYTQLTNLDAQIENFHFLQDSRIQIEDEHFIGGTLWFPDTPEQRATWIDFRFVEGGCHPIYASHEKTKQYLEENVETGDIVVTHHLPSLKCVSPQWEEDPSNHYFVSSMDHIIHEKKPNFWFFGHTHDTRHVVIDETELICNPRGYPHEINGFDIDLVVDTEL